MIDRDGLVHESLELLWKANKLGKLEQATDQEHLFPVLTEAADGDIRHWKRLLANVPLHRRGMRKSKRSTDTTVGIAGQRWPIGEMEVGHQERRRVMWEAGPRRIFSKGGDVLRYVHHC